MTNTRRPETLEQALSECAVLRRCLLKVSFVGSGADRTVERELATLRKLLKDEAAIDDVVAQVEKIADVLRNLEDRVEPIEIDENALLQSFEAHLLGECPEQQKAIKRVFSRYGQRGWVTLLTKLYEVIGPTEQRPSFWQRWFSPRASTEGRAANDIDQSGQCKKIRATLLDLMEQFSVPELLKEMEQELIERIQQLSAPEDAPEILQAFGEFVLELTSMDHVRFQRFLTVLGLRLQQMAELVDANVGIAGQHQVAASRLDAQMRAHVHALQTDLKATSSMVELQNIFEQKFDDIIHSLNQYRSETERLFTEQKQKNDKLRTALEESQAQLKTLREVLKEKQRLAEMDPLTGVGNRYHFDQMLQKEYGRWRRYREPLSLLLIDLDHFKKINDVFGHQAGDETLKTVAQVIRQQLRETDILARYGGEEFVVLMPQTTLVAATKAANKLRQLIRETEIKTSSGDFRVTASFGVAEFEENDTPDDVLARADKALYRAKGKGRDIVCAQLPAEERQSNDEESRPNS